MSGAQPTTRIEIEVDVSDAVGAPHRMRGWAVVPVDADQPPVVYCQAGGGCSTEYFDLDVGGDPSYRMAPWLAERGVAVIALDHPGLGRSDRVADLFSLTPSVVAAAHAHAFAEARRRLPCTTGLAIGLGHSMGGMLTDVLQARHRPFDAVIGLGHTGSGYPHLLTEAEHAAVRPDGSVDEHVLVALARHRATTPPAQRQRLGPHAFFLPDVPQAARDAFRAQQTELLHSCGLLAMLPDGTGADKAAIDVPVFLGFGDHDQADPRDGSVQRYRGVPELTFVVLPQTAHCHNQAPTRLALWQRIVRWIGSLA